MESVPKPSGCATVSSFKELVPPKMAMCADERVVCTPSTRVPAMATTRAAAASRKRTAATPISTSDTAHTMIIFLNMPDFLEDATEADSLFILSNCNRSPIGVMQFKDGLRQRIAREVHALYKFAYASVSGICKICAVRLTPTRRAFAKVARQC